MNIKYNIQKIISVVFLCFVFFMSTPHDVFAIGGNAIEDYTGWDKTTSSQSTVQTTTLRGSNLEGSKVDLKVLNTGNHILETNQILAIDAARKQKGLSVFRPEEQGYKPDGQFFSIADSSGNASLYYMEPEQEPKSATRGAFLGHVTGDKLYIPPTGHLEKASGKVGSTDMNTERGYVNAIDVENGRTPNTTYKKLMNADKYQLEQNQSALQKEKDDLAKNEEDLKNLISDRDSATSPEDKTIAEQYIEEKQRQISENKANIQSLSSNVDEGVSATESKKIQAEACPSGIADSINLFSLDCIVTLLAIVANLIMNLSALALGLVGTLFDYSIEIAVNSAQFIKSINIVDPTWAFVRDAANMTFIFILIYVSWQILQGNTNYNAKSSVARLVLVAILINFSLFGAKLMVDFSNIISLNIYEGIKARDVQGNDPSRGSISHRVMSSIGLPTIYNFTDAFNNETVAGCGTVPKTVLTVSIFGTIFIVVTGMTFLLAAVLFFLRILNIIVLFITSPVWVWGYVVQNPTIKSYSDKWFANMMHVVKFPIMYMLILYISLAMFAQLNTAQTTGGKSMSMIALVCNISRQSGQSGIVEQLPVMLNFVLVIAALIGALKYSIGETGKWAGTGKFASNIASKFDGYSRKISSGAAQGLYNKATTAKGLATIATIASGGGALALGGALGGLWAGKKGAAGAGGYIKNRSQSGVFGAKNWLADKVGKAATNSKTPAFLQDTLTGLSTGIKERKVYGESEKEAAARRTAKATKGAAALAKIQLEQSKIEDKEAWEKKNVGGNYAGYSDEKINFIIGTQLGELQAESMKDEAGNNIGANEYIKKAVKADGTINQDDMYKRIEEVKKTHKDKFLGMKARSFETYAREKAQARIDAEKKVLQARSVGKGKNIEDKKKQVEKLREKAKRFPDNIEAAYLEKKSKDYDYRVEQWGNTSDTVEKAKIAEQIQKERETIENKIEKLLNEIDTLEKKEAEKAEKK